MKKYFNIGIFGGTFDPFTPAHLNIVETACRNLELRELRIIPTVVDYYRAEKERLLGYYDRVKVISSALRSSIDIPTHISVSTREIDLAAKYGKDDIFVNSRRFYHTLVDEITGMDMNAVHLYVIVGADQASELLKGNWYKSEEIRKLCTIVAVNGRSGIADVVPLNTPGDVVETINVSDQFSRMSATKIRDVAKQYIANNGLEKFITEYGNNMEKWVGENVSEQLTYKVITKTPIFDLVSKNVPMLGFNPVGINAPDWVCILAKTKGSFVMVRQLRYGLMKQITEFPCGQVDKGEEPSDTALRELWEETGVYLDDQSGLIHLGSVATNPAFMNNRMHYFFVDLDKCKHHKGDQHLDEHEELDISYMPEEDVFGMTSSTTQDTPALFVCGVKLYKDYISNKGNTK